MNDLLQSIQTIVESNFSEILSVQIIADEQMIDDASGFPVVGLIDAGESYTPGKGCRLEALNVRVSVFQSLAIDSGEATIVGSGTNTGIIKLCKDIRDKLLTDASLPAGYYIADCDGFSGVQALVGQSSFIAYKSINMKYKREALT